VSVTNGKTTNNVKQSKKDSSSESERDSDKKKKKKKSSESDSELSELSEFTFRMGVCFDIFTNELLVFCLCRARQF
jgi:hypothetical protein